MRRLRRWLAAVDLARVDADVAAWYVNDGQLSERPLEGHLSPAGERLRARRLAAVARLVRAGGNDPNPCLLREPTDAQRAAWPRQ